MESEKSVLAESVVGTGANLVANDTDTAPSAEITSHQPGEYKVIRRNNKVTSFDASKISVALTKAFLDVEGGTAAASTRVHETVEQLTEQINYALTRRMPGGGTVHIEDIQDQVELALMRAGEQKVARAYVIYREERARQRAEKAQQDKQLRGEITSDNQVIKVTTASGETKTLDMNRLIAVVNEACQDLEHIEGHLIIDDALRNLFDGVSESDVNPALVMSARTLIEKEPNYSYAAARLLLDSLRREALSFVEGKTVEATQQEMNGLYPAYFKKYIARGTELELLDHEIARYDLDRLGEALKPERDQQFTYLGLQTLYDRYFIHSNNTRFELPQAFFMRVAMGLAINELDRESRAIEFYNLLSSFDFMSSTPTLFNSATLRPQLSSCYLSTVPDDLRWHLQRHQGRCPAVKIRRWAR